MGNVCGMKCRIGDCSRAGVNRGEDDKPLQSEVLHYRFKVADHCIEGEVVDFPLRQAEAATVVSNELPAAREPFLPAHSLGHLPFNLTDREGYTRHLNDWVAFPQCPVRDAHPVASLRVLDPRLHHACLTAQTRTGSSMPLRVCSPRSSNRTPAEVRASERTVSDTSTSPGAERPLMREAMLTAPP